ncbi:hypothetical protein AMS68_000706 [Peltaster fructicola]|uniref:SGNH hydrolase-type esterase domain-containing protein n=1 Tax=Peltaster fructicola TaxID=286661 RepID=A0A6H0XKN1_9PEZI|nr:hypothetical protein AMS68_000706 [Peltaster fructicola]
MAAPMQRSHSSSVYLVLLSICLTFFTGVQGLVIERSLANGVDLRILPLGDSITWGAHSSDGNGYRNDLQKKFNGNKAVYIGSEHSGNMTNNQHEGWRGYVIDQIAQRAERSLPDRPNVILIMAGTNDIGHKVDPAGAPKRLGTLLDQCHSACPDAVIILAQLTPRASLEDEVVTFNAAIPGIVEPRTKAGHKIVIVDMSNSKNGLKTSDLADGLHPDDGGYAKMATIWFEGFNTAAEKGLITAPVKYPRISWKSVGEIAMGIGRPKDTVFFGDVDGDGKDDYLSISTTGSLIAYKNNGANSASTDGWNWSPWGTIFDGSSDVLNIRIADLDGDGKADYIVVDPKTGAATAQLNGGPKADAPDHWQWTQTPVTNGFGASSTIHFADINGDGKADYLVVGEHGDVKAWLNQGKSDKGFSWKSLGNITDQYGESSRVEFADLDGDGKVDYLVVDNIIGSVEEWRNGGQNSDGAWDWEPKGEIAAGTSRKGTGVQFAKLSGDKKADYVIVDPSGSCYLWINEGVYTG